MTHTAGPWNIQSLTTAHHDYPDWQTYAIRDKSNHCLAIVGEVDRATSEHNTANAILISAAPDMQADLQAVAGIKRMIQARITEIEHRDIYPNIWSNLPDDNADGRLSELRNTLNMLNALKGG